MKQQITSLRGKNLASMRGGHLIFEAISFNVEAGAALVLSGPNGAGKSTLLRIMAGLLRPAAGVVQIAGLTDDNPQSFAMHYIGHGNGLRDGLTARENLAFLKTMLKTSSVFSAGTQLPIEEAMERASLTHATELPVGVLSAGQKRRVALASLLVCGRPVWLLDEPTTALDKAARDLFADIVAKHCATGGIVVAATHLPLGIKAQELLLIPPQITRLPS